MTMELGIEYRDEEWEDGLRCADCSRLLVEGDRYSERLDGLMGDIPIVVIVCITCALRESSD